MCGISGAFALHQTHEMAVVVNKIVADQQQRGPDHQAVVNIKGTQATALLGHNRLSIIDLSNTANQPMWDAEEQYCIVYNGEIYNYVELRQQLLQLGYHFATLSDTEVILNAFKAWGIAAINYFNGPFAFAIYDKNNQQLWLVRDRFGVKPLYYYLQDDVLYFASSSHILASHFNLKPNLEYVARGLKYLVYEDASEITPYYLLKSVLPAHHIRVQINSNQTIELKQEKYYDLQTQVMLLREKIATNSVAELLQNLLARLEQAVEFRLRSDVPVGISLSGGLDSSSVAALVAKNAPQSIAGFSYGHPDVQATEGPLVKELAEKIGISVDYIWPTAQEMVQALPEVLRAQQAPFAGFSIIAQHLVYRRVKKSGIKVLLGGQGGDEGFMGYRKYHLFFLRRLMQQKRYGACLLFLGQLIPLFCAEFSQIKLYWQHRRRYLAASGLQTVLSLPQPEIAQNYGRQPDEGWLRQLKDVTHFSLPTLLRYEDRNSMANSVESRLPFMDYQVLEFGLALPEALKLRQGFGKWPLREIMRNKIPETIRTARYKRGFDVSLATLLAAGLGHELRKSLQDSHSLIKDFLQPNAQIANLFSDQNFKQYPSRMAEAISLLWLGKCY